MFSSFRFSTPLVGSGYPKGMNWRTMTVRVIDSQLTLNFLLQLDPCLCALVGFILEYKSWLVSLGDFCQWFLEWYGKFGEVPIDWNLINVPVFRKSKKNDPGQYRTVSFQCLMERIFLGGIEKHLKDYAVIDYSQHGFMRGKSCLSYQISFHDQVTHLVDQVKPADAIFLNFSKALILSLTESFKTKCPVHSWVNSSCDGWATGSWVGLKGWHHTGDLLLVGFHRAPS